MGQAERQPSIPSGVKTPRGSSMQSSSAAYNLELDGLDQEAIQAESASLYRTREVPSDWYVDPADPEAANRYKEASHASLEDAATAFLAEYEDEEAEDEDDLELGGQVEASGSEVAADSQAVWIGLPGILTADPADEGELGWQADALCAQTDPEAFFPEKGGSTRDAKKVCGSCTVKAQCLEYALSNDERFGIWGGLSERERRRLRKRAV